MPTMIKGLALLSLVLALAGCASMRPTLGGSEPIASLAEFRIANGRSTVAVDPALEVMALQQARYMAAAGKMVHTTGRGRDFASRMRANGIKRAAAENIAYNADSAARAMQLWADSPPHRRNMLERRFGHYGLASAPDASGRRYWAMVLAE